MAKIEIAHKMGHVGEGSGYVIAGPSYEQAPK